MLLDILYTEDQANSILLMQEHDWSLQRVEKSQDGTYYHVLFDVPKAVINANKYLISRTTIGMDTVYILDITLD